MIPKKVIRIIEKEFIDSDIAEPFHNREYVEYSKRIFKLLKGDVNLADSADRAALYDIVSDIFRYYEERKFHVLL